METILVDYRGEDGIRGSLWLVAKGNLKRHVYITLNIHTDIKSRYLLNRQTGDGAALHPSPVDATG
jgi:hypothetical protein